MSFLPWLVETVKNSSLQDTSNNVDIFENVENFAVVSDVHLRKPNHETTSLFLNCLDKVLKAKPQYFILLGDIFDFISAESTFFSELWAPVFAKLKELKESGIKTVFVEGNHDFGFVKTSTKQIAESLSFATEGSLLLKLSNGEAFFLSHGDTIFCDQAYLSFRKLTKSKFAKALARIVPGRLLQWACNKYAEKSRRDEVPLQEIHYFSGIQNLFLRFPHLNLHKKTNLLFGHVHMYFSEIQQERTLGFESVHCGPSWFQAPSFSYVNAGTYETKTERHWWRSDEQKWVTKAPHIEKVFFEDLQK